MATDSDVKKWLSTQKYRADQEITPAQRLRSKYLPPRGVRTWGEWYELHDITPPKEEKEKVSPDAARKKEIRRIEDKIDKVFQDVETYQVDMDFSTPGTPEYNRAKENRDRAQAELERLRAERNLILATEEEKKTQDDLRKEKEKRQRDADAGRPTTSSDKKIEDLETKSDTVRKAITDLEQESKTAPTPTGAAFGPPEVRGGRPVTGTGGGLPTPTGPTQPTGPTGPSRGGGQRPPAGGGGADAGVDAGADVRGGDRKEDRKKSDKERYEEAILLAQSKYNMPEIIFDNVPSLGEILRQFVNKEINREGFRIRVENDIWYRQNAEPIRNRYLQIFNYDDLKKKGQAVGTSSFEIDLRKIIERVQDEAITLTGSRITDDEAIEQIAKDLYIYNLENSTNEIRQRIAKFIRPTISRIGGIATEDFGGEAGQNYNDLLATARANGFTLEQILPKDAAGKPIQASEVLRRIATGQIDVNRLKDDIRKLAATGQPDFVKDQLAQGNDLDVIYSPYRQRMASILEIPDPMTIDINDPSLRMAITKEGDMNLFDYEKALRKDKRWQYTETARDEVAEVLDTVLRDFGFRS